jgi:hypothetical protein
VFSFSGFWFLNKPQKKIKFFPELSQNCKILKVEFGVDSPWLVLSATSRNGKKVFLVVSWYKL